MMPGLFFSLVEPWQYSGVTEQTLDYVKLGLILVIGALVTVAMVFTFLAYRLVRGVFSKMDGSTPPEIRALVESLQGQVVNYRGEVMRATGTIANFQGSLNDFNRQLRTITGQVEALVMKLQRFPCESCPVLKDEQSPEKEQGFRKLGR